MTTQKREVDGLDNNWGDAKDPDMTGYEDEPESVRAFIADTRAMVGGLPVNADGKADSINMFSPSITCQRPFMRSFRTIRSHPPRTCLELVSALRMRARAGFFVISVGYV